MGLTAARQCCEQILCKNKVTPINVKPINEEDANPNNDLAQNTFPMLGNMDPDQISTPMKRMAWEMIPKNSKIMAVVQFCRKLPPDKEEVTEITALNATRTSTAAGTPVAATTETLLPADSMTTLTSSRDIEEAKVEGQEMIVENIDPLKLAEVTNQSPWVANADKTLDSLADK